MNCHKCKFKGPVVPGSSHHISCALIGDFTAQMKVLLLYKQDQELVVTDETTGDQKPFIVQDPHGVNQGWCDWPVQFDPIWIKDCQGFREPDE